MTLRSQAGFSLMEVMFASAASLVIVLAGGAIMLQAAAQSRSIESQISINRHARTAFEVLLNGAQASSNGRDGTKNIYSLDGFHSVPNGSYRSNYAFSYSSNNKTLTPDTFAPVSITCTGTALPLPDCSGTTVKSVSGWMGADASIEKNKRVIANRTFEISFTVTDPFEAARTKNSAAASTVYRTVSTLMRDEADP